MSSHVKTLQQLPAALLLPGPGRSGFCMPPASSCVLPPLHALLSLLWLACFSPKLIDPKYSLLWGLYTCYVLLWACPSRSACIAFLSLFSTSLSPLLMTPYLDFRRSMYHSLILSCLLLCLFTVLPHQKENTLRREIFISFITVSLLPGT